MSASSVYSAFGLVIASELDLPALRPSSGVPDVEVRFGPIPTRLAGAVDCGVCFEASPGKVLISLDGIARFLVAEGSEVVIDPEPQTHESTLRLFLLGLCVGLMLHQRGRMVLHATAVTRGEHAIALTGPSSVGKSTLATTFVRRGYALVSDEVCHVDFPNGSPHVVPGYPALLLWRRALEKQGLFTDDLERARPELEKYVYPVTERFALAPARLAHLYRLNSWNLEEVELIPLQGFDRFGVLLDDTFKEPYIKGMGLIRQRQKWCAAIAPHVRVSRLSWPQRWDDLDEAADLIESDVLQNASASAIPDPIDYQT